MSTSYNKFQNMQETDTNSMNAQGQVPLDNVRYGYNQNPPSNCNTTMIHIQQPEYTVEPQFPWCHFVMSMILFVFCGCGVMPLLGIIYSANAYSSHGDKAYERMRRQNTMAKVFWIISIVTTIICWIGAIIAIAIAVSATTAAVNTVSSNANQNNHYFGN